MILDVIGVMKKSWDESKHPKSSLNEIIDLVIKSPSDIVVVTGGEPLMHNLNELTIELKKHKRVHLETSGAYNLTGNWDWITLSPKKENFPLPEIYKKTNELKCIIYNDSDFEFAINESKKFQKIVYYIFSQSGVRKITWLKKLLIL